MAVTVIVAVLAGTASAVVILLATVALVDRRLNRVISQFGDWKRERESTANRLQSIADDLKSLHLGVETMARSLAEGQSFDAYASLDDLTTRIALQQSVIVSALRGLSSRLDTVTGDVRDIRGEVQHGSASVSLLSGSVAETTVALQERLGELADGLRRSVSAIAVRFDEQRSEMAELSTVATKLAEHGALTDVLPQRLDAIAGQVSDTRSALGARHDALTDDLQHRLGAIAGQLSKTNVAFDARYDALTDAVQRRIADIAAQLDTQRAELVELSASVVTLTTNVNASRDELAFLLHSGFAQIDEIRQSARHQNDDSRKPSGIT